jgi:GMP synthase (glutamine-hydrolysing)
MQVYHWHTEGFEVPAGGELLAQGEVFPNQAFRLGEHAYGLQFHPETTVPIFSTWMAEAGHMLSWPGAQPREEQFATALEHDPVLADWLDRFLQRFTGRE